MSHLAHTHAHAHTQTVLHKRRHTGRLRKKVCVCEAYNEGREQGVMSESVESKSIWLCFKCVCVCGGVCGGGVTGVRVVRRENKWLCVRVCVGKGYGSV